MQFDWFQATVMERTDRFLEWSKAAYADCDSMQGKGLNRYDHRLDYFREGLLMASISYGGPNGFPNIKATSGASPRLAGLLRNDFPHQGQIRVTRVDSCFDFESPKGFETTQGVMRQFAYGRSIQTEHQGDYDRAEKGRSYYLGSKSSTFRAVLYEKGIESAEEIKAAGMPPRPNLCRLEGRLRPQHTDAKVAASTLSPEAVWGCCRWGPALLRQLFSSSIERVQMSEYRVPDTVLSRRAMVKQYFRTIGDMLAESDHDHDVLGKMLADLYDSIDRERSNN